MKTFIEFLKESPYAPITPTTANPTEFGYRSCPIPPIIEGKRLDATAVIEKALRSKTVEHLGSAKKRAAVRLLGDGASSRQGAPNT